MTKPAGQNEKSSLISHFVPVVDIRAPGPSATLSSPREGWYWTVNSGRLLEVTHTVWRPFRGEPELNVGMTQRKKTPSPFQT